ncbi:MAG: hypothetical protein PHC62_00960 [Candidatus Izemoplasmatales bacterium]|nr:hypothetical protein [Candidatus Izemoplasmatales bacterium]
MGELKNGSINLSYPRSDEFEVMTRLAILDFDKERKKDLMENRGFIISDFKGIKKDLKDENSIFSKRYGQTLKDLNPSADRYKCDCGFTKSRINFNTECPLCGTKVKYVDDDFSYFGWILLKHDHVIHPLMYRKIESLIGKRDFENIMTYYREENVDGIIQEWQQVDPNEPFKFYGMKLFEEHFDTILEYYVNKRPTKKDLYHHIIANKEKVFTNSIPVFTTLLRPFDIENNAFYHEESNPKFNIINRNATKLNNRVYLQMENSEKIGADLLREMQTTMMELYEYITKILTGKKGNIRQLFGGRYNFSSRCVIIGDNKLRIDQIKLPYKCLIVWLEPQIKNILVKSYNMNYNQAEEIVFKARVKPDMTVVNIINSIIASHKEGLPVLVNRNPSINYSSILQMFCIGMNDDLESDYTMSLPLQVLRGFGADFDCMM